MVDINNYCEIVKGEIEILREEIEKFNQQYYSAKLNASDFLECVTPHLDSIERKTGRNSIEYINISTQIVDAICKKVLAFTNLTSADSIVDKLSPSDMVKFYASQRENLTEALNIFRRLENMNMDYAYRVKAFNKTKDDIEKSCREKGIETRTLTQKNIDHSKTVGAVTGEVTMEAAGCLISMAVKVAIILVIFLILMAIFGVER